MDPNLPFLVPVLTNNRLVGFDFPRQYILCFFCVARKPQKNSSRVSREASLKLHEIIVFFDKLINHKTIVLFSCSCKISACLLPRKWQVPWRSTYSLVSYSVTNHKHPNTQWGPIEPAIYQLENRNELKMADELHELRCEHLNLIFWEFLPYFGFFVSVKCVMYKKMSI